VSPLHLQARIPQIAEDLLVALNEPGEAESICLDILQIDPNNKDASKGLELIRKYELQKAMKQSGAGKPGDATKPTGAAKPSDPAKPGGAAKNTGATP